MERLKLVKVCKLKHLKGNADDRYSEDDGNFCCGFREQVAECLI